MLCGNACTTPKIALRGNSSPLVWLLAHSVTLSASRRLTSGSPQNHRYHSNKKDQMNISYHLKKNPKRRAGKCSQSW